MDRKRLADRTKHKENRLEGKNRLERIENEVSEIKAGLQSMMQQLQSMQAQHSAPALFGHEASTAHGPAMLGPSVTHAAAAAHLGSMQFTTQHAFTPWPSLSPSTSSPWPWASAAANPATRLWTHVPRRDEMAKVINCRCGLQHLDRFDTIDQCNVTTLYQHHIAFAPQSPTPAEARSQGQGQSSLSMSSSPSSSFELPRNPSLPAMMLHSPEENLATYFITGFLREYRNKSMEQLLAFYLLGYRYMRVSS
jgi:hypothetical protein